jgi:hypothetical protein
MLIQICKKNQYGNGFIEKTIQNSNVKEAFQEVKNIVSGLNLNNALTEDYQLLSWETFFIDIQDKDGEPLEDIYFGGFTGMGAIRIYNFSSGELKEEHYPNSRDLPYKVAFSIGEKEGKIVVAKTLYKQAIDSIEDVNLSTKDIYFINIVQ